MIKSAEEIDVEIFRSQMKAELNQTNSYLAGWLESEEWLGDKGNKVNSGQSVSHRPWAKKGREFISFYETFYQVLSWYKIWKISRFRECGWKIDECVVKNIKSKFTILIKEALSAPESKYHDFFMNYDPDPISFYTAIDYKFQNITGSKITNVLDFGSGIGRQSFQWCSQDGMNLFSFDAIESLYLLQNRIYSLLFQESLNDYFYDPIRFHNRDFYSQTNKVYHMPTWKFQLLPEKYFDLIICAQVLQEVNKNTLEFLLEQFKRVIKKNGFLYIRDNEYWAPSHRIVIGRELLKQGWELIFKYHGREGYDIEGVPRLWVFTGKDNNKCFRHLSRIKKVFLPSYPQSYSSWKNYGLPI